MHKIRFPLGHRPRSCWGLDAPLDPLPVFKEPTSKGRAGVEGEGKGKGREREREGKRSGGSKGWEGGKGRSKSLKYFPLEPP